MTEVYATPEAACAQQAPAAYASGSRPILSVRQIEKVYGNKDSVTKALRESSAPVGSSASTSFGSATMARAAAMRCFWPPDIW